MSRLIPSYIEQGLRIEHLERELAEARGDVEHLEREIANEIAKSTDCANYLADLVAANKILVQEKDQCSNGWDAALATVQRLERELAEAIAKERERCALVVERVSIPYENTSSEAAAAIRKGE